MTQAVVIASSTFGYEYALEPVSSLQSIQELELISSLAEQRHLEDSQLHIRWLYQLLYPGPTYTLKIIYVGCEFAGSFFVLVGVQILPMIRANTLELPSMGIPEITWDGWNALIDPNEINSGNMATLPCIRCICALPCQCQFSSKHGFK